jgi:hypothetical protein
VSFAELDERICFYVFRHLALATWKRAKISAADIAELAGHLDPAMAKHYASAASGLPGPILIEAVKAGPEIENLFPNTPFSPLIKPPRGPRKASLAVIDADILALSANEGITDGEEETLIPPALTTNPVGGDQFGGPTPDPAQYLGSDDDDLGLNLDALDIYAVRAAPVADVPAENRKDIRTGEPIAAVPSPGPGDFSEFGPPEMPRPIYKPVPRPEPPPYAHEQARVLQEQREMNKLVDDLIAADDRRIAALKAARLAAGRQSSSPNLPPAAPDEGNGSSQDTPSDNGPRGPGGRR